MFWWRNRRAPSTGAPYHTGASSQRSRPVPRLVVLDVLVLLSWSCRRSRWCSCFLPGRYSVPFTPGYSAVSQLQVHISGFCPGKKDLALVRSVVPYTLVLYSMRSRRWCLRLLADRWPCPNSYRRVALRPKLRSSSQTRSIPEIPRLYKTRVSPIDAL